MYPQERRVRGVATVLWENARVHKVKFPSYFNSCVTGFVLLLASAIIQ